MKALIGIFSIIIFASCTTGENFVDLEEGMSKKEVIGILGRPDSFKRAGNKTAIQYTNKLITGWSWDRADYFVIFEDDKVIEYGTGVVRVKQSTAGPVFINNVFVR
jgi:hypothetical protein